MTRILIASLLLLTAASAFADCSALKNDHTLCVEPSFTAQVKFTQGGATKDAKLVPFSTPQSGIFSFFDESNWEVMVKILNGCGINNRIWVFASATTDLPFELTVTDTRNGTTRTYTNPAGQRARAIIDTNAFSCTP